MFKQSMKIQDYEVWVHLGCSDDEQTFSQPIHVSVELHFDKNVVGLETDQLRDAIDYVEVAEVIKTQAQKKKYHLVEHLCGEVIKHLFQVLKERHVKGFLTVHVKKIRVPVENLRNGVVFTCEAKL